MKNKSDNKILDITKDVKWIGVLDYDIKTFDVVMTTEHGTTYNSYFINAEKKVIIETVKETFLDTYLSKIEQITPLCGIDYIVVNHTEPDHSGSLIHMLKQMPNVTVVGSVNAIKYLSEIVNFSFKHIIVKDDDTLDIGGKTLKFISAPNLHWPDSMYTLLVEDNILFTCDSFGAHYCDEQMFDDLIDNYTAAFDYYFNVILRPYSKFMLKAIEKISNLPLNIIAPGHGPILRSTWKEKVEHSKTLSIEYVRENSSIRPKVLLAYVSAYGYTKQMAENIAQGISSINKIDVEILDIENIDLGELDSKMVWANAFVIGCPTINQNILLPIYKMCAIINPIRDRGKLAMAFGSYGWSGEGVNIIDAILKNLKLDVVESKKMLFCPDSIDSQNLQELGKIFGEKLISKII